MFDLIIETHSGLDGVNFRGYLVSDDLLECLTALLLGWRPSLGCIPLEVCAMFSRIITWRRFMPLALFLALW